MKYKKYKFIILLLTLVIIYFRPLYSIFLLLLLYVEYYNAAYMFFLIKTNKYYIRLNITEPDLSSMTNIDLWFTYCKINAFIKIYYLFLKKKKITLSSILLTSVIYLFQIPFRLLKLSYYFITSKESFRTSLTLLTLDLFILVRDLQIEVLNKKIYLNCNNAKKMVNLILNSNKLIDKTNFCQGMIQLQKASKNFSKKEEEYGKKEVNLCKIYDLRGNVISRSPHYTVIENKTSIHAISNTNVNLLAEQRVDGIIPTLVKNGAIQPGTIISRGISSVKIIPNRSIWVPNSEIDIIRANHEEFEVDANIRSYQVEKDETFREILMENFKLGKNIPNELWRGLRYNEFTRDLNAVNTNFFQEEYDSIFEQISRQLIKEYENRL